jgi:DivIVA domain-containing protein
MPLHPCHNSSVQHSARAFFLGEDFMPDAPQSVPFDVALRGYDRDQVDAHLASLESEFTGALSERDRLAERVKQLEGRVEELHLQTDDDRPPVEPNPSALNGFGVRIEKIMRLAEDEANAVREEAQADIDRDRTEAKKKVAALQQAAEKDAAAHRAKVQAEATGLLDKARQEAARVRADADAQAGATREEASGHLESVRARAAQAAADFETALAKRRQKAEADHLARTNSAERELAETVARTDQLRAEAEKMRSDAERRSQEMLQAAQRESAELVNEARAQADRTRRESERELASLSKRRDAITDQLRNVREMLSTLTGGAVSVPDEPAAAEEPEDVPSQRNGNRSGAARR